MFCSRGRKRRLVRRTAHILSAASQESFTQTRLEHGYAQTGGVPRPSVRVGIQRNVPDPPPVPLGLHRAMGRRPGRDQRMHAQGCAGVFRIVC